MIRSHDASRRGALGMLGAAALAGPAMAAPPRARPARGSVYDRSIVIDAQGAVGEFDPKAKPTDPPSAALLSQMRTAGVTAISMTVGPVGNGQDRYAETLEGFATATETIAAFPDDFMLILKGSDLAAAKRLGRTGIICNLQDTAAIGTDLDRVDKFKLIGLRVLQLTYNRRNISGDGSLERANGGISEFGRQMIAAINRNDLVLDLSHGGARTQAEAIAESKATPVISHTGCRDLVDNPRNTYDQVLKALADKGGVVGIYFMPFLRASGQPRAEDVIRHLEHAVNVCGEDHVGLGTDGITAGIVIDDAYRAAQKKFYEDRKAAGIAAPGEAADVFNFVPEYNSPRRFETLAQDLSRRGWTDARIEKVLGANFARVFAEVWKG